MPAPIILFTFNRPVHTRRTVEALTANDLAAESDLIVFCDGPRNNAEKTMTDAVSLFVENITGFKSITVIKRDYNFGLARSIIDGVTSVINARDRCIVMEDDLVTSKFFLRYMNEALDRYADDDRVMHVAAYMWPISTRGVPESFFLRCSSCWGWGTWARAWRYFSNIGKDFIDSFDQYQIQKFNLDGAYDYWSQLLANEADNLKSWAVYWYASVYARGGYCLHPWKSLVENIGFDSSGINCGYEDNLCSSMAIKPIGKFPVRSTDFRENKVAMRRIQAYLKNTQSNKIIFKKIEDLAVGFFRRLKR